MSHSAPNTASRLSAYSLRIRLTLLSGLVLALLAASVSVFYPMWYEERERRVLVSAAQSASDVNAAAIEEAVAMAGERAARVRSDLVVVSLVTFIAGLLAIYLIGSIVTRPLKTVINATERIAHGDLSERTPVGNPEGEIGRLALSINYMLDQLEKLNGELAEQVQLRTRELAKQSEELRKTEDERAGLEEQLQQSQKMEAIGVLAGGVAHDFNNLLMLITGNNSLAMSLLPSDHVVQENLKEIEQASDGAVSLTRQLLAFSRRQVLQAQVINLNEIIGRLEKMLGRLIGEDIELETVLDPQVGLVKADPGQIEQVIMNLAVNARDAMPDGGKFVVETQNVVMDESYSMQHDVVKAGAYGPYTMVAVTDTGTGMDVATQQRIFDPFFTTKARGKGTGLGLSTVYGIIKQSGGYIWVYSEMGKGTVFKFYLPHADSEIRVKELPRAQVHSGGDETILLVEDDESVRKLCKHSLEQCGYTVLEGEDPMDAMRVCEQYTGDIHLILTDVVMPKMSGPEMIELLEPVMPQSKVLYMSGYTDNVVLTTYVLEPGMNFLQKPFSLDALAEKVRAVLDE